jgi:beta-glucosidase
VKALKGFKRVKIAAGKTQKVSVVLPYSSFEAYNRTTGKMTVDSGEYEVFYGNSSDEKNLKVGKIRIM